MTTKFADVSVIMPAYMAEKSIARALSSIGTQTLLPKEIIVVDDGSHDQTAKIALGFENELGGSRLQVIQQVNQGPGAARNRALRESSGTYIAFLDADDEWLPEKLERSVNEITEGNYALVSHNGWVVESNGKTSDLNCSSRFQAAEGRLYAGLYEKGFIDTCTVVCLRDHIMEVGGFDPTLPVGQDFDLFLAILSKPNRPFLVFSDQLVRYHITPGSVTSNTWKRLKCQIRILRRYSKKVMATPGGGVKSIVFRTLAVHYEAFAVFNRRRNRMSAFMVCLHLVPALIKSVLMGVLLPYSRPENLRRGGLDL